MYSFTQKSINLIHGVFSILLVVLLCIVSLKFISAIDDNNRYEDGDEWKRLLDD